MTDTQPDIPPHAPRRRVWNVLTPVVALVEADAPEDAVRAHRELLERQGHLVHDEGGDVFESEDLLDDQQPDLRVRPQRPRDTALPSMHHRPDTAANI